MTTPADQPDALTAFIVARIDDDERAAKEQQEFDAQFQQESTVAAVLVPPLALLGSPGDPDRVLRQVERDRRILADHARGQAGFIWVESAEVTDRSEVMEEWTNAEGARLARVPYWICTRCTDWYPDAEIDDDPHASHEWPCLTVRLLALPYAAHPDYRSEWRPA